MRAQRLQGSILLVLLWTATTASVALPPARSPADLWTSAPPTADEMAETVGSLREMLPDGAPEDTSEAELLASIEHYHQLRDGRDGPIWANHSRAERTANLQQHLASRRSARRRMQAGRPLFQGDSEQAKRTSLAVVLDAAGSTCDDPLATNVGRSPPCAYDCADLQREYFPAPQSQTTRCFLFDPATETWPEVGGQGGELLSMRQQRFETHTYVSREDGTNPPPAGVSFTMGEGRECREVMIESTFVETGEKHTEVVCLVDGEHEYNHTIAEEHSVEVVGFAESGVHDGAGGTTKFVVGECTDALIRITTTSAGGSPMTWSLDDGGHNGPWMFEATGEEGVVEHETCMFDNEFSLLRQGGGSSWRGSVEVAGFIHYHNTITVPNDENWIVQGTVDPVSGLPSSLDGRFKSGSAVDRSHANIILRHLRISSQIAPLDTNTILRAGQPAGARYGGAFEYDGGSADQSNLVKIIFISVVFDHCTAGTNPGTAGAVSIEGRAGRLGPNPPIQNWGKFTPALPCLLLPACRVDRERDCFHHVGLHVFPQLRTLFRSVRAHECLATSRRHLR
eukprot:COSAG04_NODE_637_length_11700_cov_478.131885_9_plen_567_part_00